MKIKYVPFGVTQSSQKIWAYFIQLAKTEGFTQDINTARAKLNIPITGYEEEGKIPPTEWKYNHELYSKKNKIVGELCLKYNLFPGHWWMTIEFFLFFNQTVYPVSSSGELITQDDAYQMLEYTQETIDEFNRFYPVIIRLSPYASQRDVTDWIKKNWYLIEQHQNEYRDDSNKIANFKKRRPPLIRRNDYIYQNQNMTLRELELNLERMGYDMDQGSISKVISLERKRRKKL